LFLLRVNHQLPFFNHLLFLFNHLLLGFAAPLWFDASLLLDAPLLFATSFFVLPKRKRKGGGGAES
jgi:hypothetical protein